MEFDESAQAQQQFVDEAVAKCPFTMDERQSAFFETLDNLKKELDNPAIISMAGFPASHVNLGWLKGYGEQAVETFVGRYGAHYISRIIELLLERTVQRLKHVDVKEDSSAKTLEVSFRAKDDEGYYSYSFEVDLEVEDTE